MNYIARLFGRKPTPDPSSGLRSEVAKPLVHAAYPPKHDGIPLADVAELMEVQQEFIRRLKLSAAALDVDFEDRFVTPIRNVAAYVSNIPGSKDSIYGGPGGLFRACIESAFYSYQSTGGKIFTGPSSVEERYALEKRWCYVCFLAGLVWPLGNTLEKIRVRDSAGNTWTTRVEGLTPWAEAAGVDHYFVGWPKDDVEPGPSVVGAALALSLGGAKAIRWIEQGSPDLITALVEIASNVRTDINGIAYDLVKARWEQLKKNEQARIPQNYGRVQFGQHLAPLIVDAMRECMASSTWVVNDKVVLADTKGVYLIWPQAAHDLLGNPNLKAQSGIPTTPSGLLQAMLDERMLYTDAQQSAYVDVADNDGELHLAVKLLKPEACVEGYSPASFLKPVDAQDVAKTDPLVEEDLREKNQIKSEVTLSQKKNTSQTVVKTVAGAEERALRPAPPPASDVLLPTLGAPAEPVGTPSGAAVPEDAAASTLAPETGKQVDCGAMSAQPEKEVIDALVPESSDYTVPEEIVKTLGKPFSLMLAKVVKELNKPEGKMMLITNQPHFIGLPMDAIQRAITAPADLLCALQKNGWLHPDPTKPRAMMIMLSVSAGGSGKAFYVQVTRSFAKRAKLPF